MNSDTWNIHEGLLKLRWGNSPKEVIATYPQALSTHAIKQAASKKEPAIDIPPALVIEQFITLPACQLRAVCSFSNEQLVGIDLYPRTTYQDRSLRIFLERALQTLLAQLGLDASIALPVRTQAIIHPSILDGVHVEIETQKTDFAVFLYAPNTEELGRQNDLHRRYRRIQAERGLVNARLSPEQWTDAMKSKV